MAEIVRGIWRKMRTVSKESRQREGVVQQYLNSQRFLTLQTDNLNLSSNGLTTVTFLAGAIQSRMESIGTLRKKIKPSGSFVEQALDTFRVCEELGRDRILTDIIAHNEGEPVSTILRKIINELDSKRTLMNGVEKFRYAAFLSSRGML